MLYQMHYTAIKEELFMIQVVLSVLKSSHGSL